MVLAMTACGTDPKSVDYFGMSYSDIQDNMEQTVSALVSFSDEDIQSGAEYYDSNGMDAFAHLLTSWGETVSDLGSYQGLGDLTVTKAQKTVTADQVLHFSDRDVVVSYVYEYNYETEAPELTDASADLVYSLGEKMGKAGMNTLMGMGTVFVVLILISLIIYCFRFISVIQNKAAGKGKKNEAEAGAVVEQIGQREEQLTDDLELVAVISAAVAASTGASADSFVVRSIRRR
jgi:sodium pump decarboxylase gamma subunit